MAAPNPFHTLSAELLIIITDELITSTVRDLKPWQRYVGTPGLPCLYALSRYLILLTFISQRKRHSQVIAPILS